MAESHDRSSLDQSSDKVIDNLTPEELIELQEAFRVFDQDGDVRTLSKNLPYIKVFPSISG